MTLATEISKSGPYAGSGTTGPFTVGFRFLDPSHLRVIRTGVTGIAADLAYGVEYTASGAGATTGTVTLSTALTSGEKLTIIRDVPFTQEADYVAGDSFPAESHEQALDLLTMQTQQLKEQADRTLTFAPASAIQSAELPAPQGGSVFAWNSLGDQIINVPLTDLGTVVQANSWRTEKFNGDGTTTNFTLLADPGSLNATFCYVGGVVQTPGVDFTVAANVLTFISGAPPVGTNNVVVQYGQAAPASGPVTVDSPLVSLTDFGAVGDGVTDDTAAVIAAEASTYSRIYLPHGIFPVTTGSVLYKLYYGAGQLKLNGQLVGQTYSNISVLTPNVSSPAGYGEGDISQVNVEKIALYGNRTSLDQYYFEARTTPHFVEFVNHAGHSGSTARVMYTAPAGQNWVQVNSVSAELQVGVQIEFADGLDTGSGITYQRRTISAITAPIVYFTEPLTTTVTVGSVPVYITIAKRTMNAYEYVGLEHRGGGDAYAWCARVQVYDTVKQSGQAHNYRTATGGIIGGDMVGGNHGVYLTGWECSYSDTTYLGSWQVSCIASVNSFNRTTDNGTFGCVWIGNWMQSYGTEYCDAGYSIVGRWKSGFNTVGADLGVAEAAITMKAGHKIYFAGGITPDDHGAALWGNLPGGTSIGVNNSLGAMEHKVNEVSVIAYNNTNFFFRDNINVTFNKNAYMKQGQKLFFDGNVGSPQNYIYDDGSFVRMGYGNTDLILMNGSKLYLGNTGRTVEINQTVNFTSQTSNTFANSGFASALPGPPVFYMSIKVDGVDYKIPVYGN